MKPGTTPRKSTSIAQTARFAGALFVLLVSLCMDSGAEETAPAEPSPLGTKLCEPMEGVRQLLDLPDRSVLLFGELHGTDRGPAAFGSVVCHLAREHAGLTVGLEISHTEQERIDAYMASAGTAEDRSELLSGPFWTDEYQDGRRSRAMTELLER
ncbi:MAG: hypothetical protein R3244_10100, partial [Thermoanaerobaculia bacterium]|nr:hypothetical protein [Thermoanaerobaculia bacterium]